MQLSIGQRLLLLPLSTPVAVHNRYSVLPSATDDDDDDDISSYIDVTSRRPNKRQRNYSRQLQRQQQQSKTNSRQQQETEHQIQEGHRRGRFSFVVLFSIYLPCTGE